MADPELDRDSLEEFGLSGGPGSGRSGGVEEGLIWATDGLGSPDPRSLPRPAFRVRADPVIVLRLCRKSGSAVRLRLCRNCKRNSHRCEERLAAIQFKGDMQEQLTSL